MLQYIETYVVELYNILQIWFIKFIVQTYISDI